MVGGEFTRGDGVDGMTGDGSRARARATIVLAAVVGSR